MVEALPRKQWPRRGCSLRMAPMGLDGTVAACHCQLAVVALFQPIQSTSSGCFRWWMMRMSWARNRCRQVMEMPFLGQICAEARPTPFHMSDRVKVYFILFVILTYNSELCFLLQQVTQFTNGFDAFNDICWHFIHCWGAILFYNNKTLGFLIFFSIKPPLSNRRRFAAVCAFSSSSLFLSLSRVWMNSAVAAKMEAFDILSPSFRGSKWRSCWNPALIDLNTMS